MREVSTECVQQIILIDCFITLLVFVIATRSSRRHSYKKAPDIHEKHKKVHNIYFAFVQQEKKAVQKLHLEK